MRRFEGNLFRREAGSEASSKWEDSKLRQERKRAEGLKQQEESWIAPAVTVTGL
ncbi:hypothetical protein N7G274_004439 [Stereocaulon virgatum]|uniref:Uncharacterized protein n=1 Tax=Stereocaulon virgatum TaxID=373712 RepID=A0ABR4AA90_9LECA